MHNFSMPLAADDMEVGAFRLSLIARRLVIAPDRLIRLTPNEARLLALLIRTPEQVIPSETILEQVWDYEGGKTALTSTIHRLRRKIEPVPQSPRYLQQHGEGYALFPFLQT